MIASRTQSLMPAPKHQVVAGRGGVREIRDILQDVLAKYNLPGQAAPAPVFAPRWATNTTQSYLLQNS